MTNLLFGAIGLCLVIAILSSFFATSEARRGAPSSGTLQGFLLANGNLTTIPVVSLLVSASFGLNGLFYQVWLGYSVGAWGMVAQIAWGASYILLARHVTKIRRARSLHDLLGGSFGPKVRVVAALFSVLGFCALMGWEIAISRQTFGEFIRIGGEVDASSAPAAGAWISGILVFGCLIYTIYGGLRGNSIADLFQNVVKLAGFGLVTALLIMWLVNGRPIWDYVIALFPTFDTMVAKIGFFGLITNIVFSLAWQFVDASTWQSILATSSRAESETKKDLKISGYAVMIAPGILGTLLGATLAYSPGITSDNILFQAISIVGTSAGVLFLVFLAIACCVMSVVDGLLLSSGYALVVDVAHPDKTLEEIDLDEARSTTLLIKLRLVLIGIGIFAAWGVHEVLEALGSNLFSFVYLVIIPQLAILGPVLASLAGRKAKGNAMLTPLLVSFGAGVASTLYGQSVDNPYFTDGAGTLTALISVAMAFAVSKRETA